MAKAKVPIRCINSASGFLVAIVVGREKQWQQIGNDGTGARTKPSQGLNHNRALTDTRDLQRGLGIAD